MEVPDFDLPAELHAGLFVCSHNKDVLETAEFDNVRIVLPSKADFQACREYIGSHIETVDVTTGQRKVSSGDASYGSLIYTVPVAGGKPKQITPTGPSYLHGWSPDGKWLTYTAQRPRARRRFGVQPGWKIHLFQFGPQRQDATLADETGPAWAPSV